MFEKFEYRELTYIEDMGLFSDWLNIYGKDGWELVTYKIEKLLSRNLYKCIFKRKI